MNKFWLAARGFVICNHETYDGRVGGGKDGSHQLNCSLRKFHKGDHESKKENINNGWEYYTWENLTPDEEKLAKVNAALDGGIFYRKIKRIGTSIQRGI